MGPVREGLAEVCQSLLVCEGCLLELYLVGNSVDFDIARLGEGDVILDPDLSELFGDQFFEDFTAVILGVCEELFEELQGAERFSVGHKEHFLFLVGLEAKAISLPTACLVKAGDIGHEVGAGDCHIDHAIKGEAPDVVVRIGKFVVVVDHVCVQGDVCHFRVPLLLFSETIIPPLNRIVNSVLLKKIKKFVYVFVQYAQRTLLERMFDRRIGVIEQMFDRTGVRPVSRG